MNTYKVVSKLYNVGFNNEIVTFIDHDNEHIDLPDPEISALHTAFARVFYASGAGEYIDLIWRDMDTTRVLSTDGSTGLHLLNVALQRVVVV